MEKMIKNLHISNYKSIDKLDLNCERINVFVGEPNTGKSNILEALDLSFLSWMMGVNQSIIKWNEQNPNLVKEVINLPDFFRIDSAIQMFHLGNIQQPIQIIHHGFSVDNTSIEFKHDKNNDKNYFQWNTIYSHTRFDGNLVPLADEQIYSSPIKPYKYSELKFHDIGNYYNRLMPPYGNNIADVIYYNNDLKKFASEFVTEYGLELVIDLTKHEISFQQRLNDGIVMAIPFKALADTFKRMLFYIAAVKHNNGSIITLDEPDTHAFPNYVSLLADEIIKQKNNQFFITTHNPYLLNQLIEQTPQGDLAVFVCGFDKSEKSTYAKRLSNEDLSELNDYGVDIFFNLNRYLNDGIEHSARM